MPAPKASGELFAFAPVSSARRPARLLGLGDWWHSRQLELEASRTGMGPTRARRCPTRWNPLPVLGSLGAPGRASSTEQGGKALEHARAHLRGIWRALRKISG
jgi:hypothetical protein